VSQSVNYKFWTTAVDGHKKRELTFYNDFNHFTFEKLSKLLLFRQNSMLTKTLALQTKAKAKAND